MGMRDNDGGMDLPNILVINKNDFHVKNYVCLDFEIDTSHGDFGHPVHPANQMLLACWSLGPDHPAFEEQDKVYSVWGNEYELKSLVDHLNAAEMLVAHNAKYELGWLKRCGFDIGSIIVFDTKIAEYVLSGNLKMSTSLDDCCKRRGWRAKDPVVDKMMKAKVNPIHIPRRWLQGRCIQDVNSTEDLFKDQLAHLDRTNRLGVMMVRTAFTPVLTDMEFQGMMLDEERVMEEYEREQANEHECLLKLQDMMGALNPGSTKDLAQWIYIDLGFEELRKNGKPVRTAGDKPVTNIATIDALEAKTPEQKQWKTLYFEWNSSKQRISKYLDFYVAVCNQMDGVFYAQFNQTQTATHRLSSSGMRIKFEHVKDDKGNVKEGTTQFQNQPREYKRIYKAKNPDFYFVEEDGSGLEFRVAGMVGDDPQIKEDINNPDFDPHYQSAMVINGYDSYEPVSKEQRTAAKAHTFKPLFGGQSGTNAQKRYYEAFNERYSSLTGTQDGWLSEAKFTKRVILPWGLRLYFPHIKADKKGYIPERAQIFNAPIQSFATADIIPIQATLLWHLIRDNGYEDVMILVNTIHDSVLAEVHKDYMEIYKELVTLSWQLVFNVIGNWYGEDVLNMMDGMPLGTEILWGDHWNEGDEVSYDITKDTIKECA